MNSATQASPSLAAQPDLGAYSIIEATASIEPTVRVESHVVIGARVTIGRESVIGSGTHVGARVAIGAAVRIGCNCTVLPDITIAAKAEIRAGSVVTRSVPPAAIVEGNPATITGYVDAPVGPRSAVQVQPTAGANTVEATNVRGVTVHNFPIIVDLRGNLTVCEFEEHIPFRPQRYFMVFDVPSKEIRGEHAHRACHQFLVCVRGSCSVVADDGEHRVEVSLDVANRGLYLPPMTWGIQYKYSSDALLLVFASHPYEAADYIRSYDEFVALAGRPQ